MKRKKMEYQLIEPMIEHLTGDVIDLTQDYAEMALDTFLQPGMLQDVPVIGTALKLGRSILSIKDLIATRNYYVFISEMRKAAQADSILQKRIEEHLLTVENDPEKRQKEIEWLLLYIERYKEQEKAKYMANIYRAYLNNPVSGINWETATAFFEILDRILIQDICDFEKVFAKGASSQVFNDNSGLLRLSALGLLQYFNGREEAYGHNKSGLAVVTSQGKLFYSIIKYGKAI